MRFFSSKKNLAKEQARREHDQAVTKMMEFIYSLPCSRNYIVGEHQQIENEMSELSTDSINKLRVFAEGKVAEGIPMGAAVMHLFLLKNWDIERFSRSVDAITAYFDLAFSLGWINPKSNFVFTLGASYRGDNLSYEQGKSLLILKDSRWTKNLTLTGGTKSQKTNYPEYVMRVVIERPHDVYRIIELFEQGRFNFSGKEREQDRSDDLVAMLKTPTHASINEGIL